MRWARWCCVGVLAGCLTAELPQFRSTRVDVDGDGYDSIASGGDDCDDTNQLVNPSRTEKCDDGLDNNCDGRVDDVGSDSVVAYVDQDGDGYGTDEPVLACASRVQAAAGVAATGGDCDDTRADVHPGVRDVCNGIDDDCDEHLDEDEVAYGAERWFDSLEGAVQGAFDIELCPATEVLEVSVPLVVNASSGAVVIRGPGADALTLRPAAAGRVVRVSGGKLVLEGVTIEGAVVRPVAVEGDGSLEFRGVVVRNSGAGAVEVTGSTGGSQPEFRAVASQLYGNGGPTVDGGAIRARRGFRIELLESELYDNVGNLGGAFAAVPLVTGEERGQRELVIEDSLIAGNVATDGGGLYLDSVDHASLPRTLVSGNVATDDGGGISMVGTILRGDPETDIAGNHADDGGGIYALNSDIASLRIGGNAATGDGGGLALSADRQSSSYLFDALVYDNTASASGGGLYVLPGQAQTTFVSAARFRGNQASAGGGIYLDVQPLFGRSSTLSVGVSAFGGDGVENIPVDIELSNAEKGLAAAGGATLSTYCDDEGCRQ